MNLKYQKQSNCPEDELLLAYKSSRLAGEERQAVALHLLFCDACLEALRFLPSDADENRQAADQQAGSEIEPPPLVGVGLAEALARFREREAIRTAHPPKTIEQVERSDGLRIGQIWRTRLEGIVAPGSESKEKLSVSDFDSRPHLVVITDLECPDVSPGDDRRAILIAPVSGDVEFADEGDFVVDQKTTPLGYTFMIELWNEQPMLRENLDCCLSEINAFQRRVMLEQLQLEREKISTAATSPFSLERVVMDGSYDDPLMRFRAHEREETLYLRQPVEALKELRLKPITDFFPKAAEERKTSENWVLPLAASTTRRGDRTSSSDAVPAIFGAFKIGDVQFEVAEDSEGLVYLLGSAPSDATRLRLGQDCYELKQAEFKDMVEISGVGSIKVERYLRQHEIDPANYPVRFDRL